MPHRLSLAKQSELIRRRSLSPVELVAAHLRQIEKHNPALNAFVVQLAAAARAAARAIESAPASGPLHGVPLTVKDSFDMEALPTLCGSRFRLWHRASKDATAVSRVRRAGALILGKTNCPEFLANYETDNHITGRTNNPWNLDFTAGGSSGGESAAIAAFCSAGGIGSDGGGSIRVPAHFCGIAGLKPTPGRVSAAGHFPEISHPGGLLGVAGPMARTAADLRILFEVLAGYDCEDPFSAPVAARKPRVGRIRVGLVEQWPDAPVTPAVAEAVRKAARAIEALGLPIEPFIPKGLERAPHLWWFFFAELPAQFTRELLTGREHEAHWTGTELLNRVPHDMHISGRTVVENLGARDRMRCTLLQQMKEFPVLLAPACCIPAFRHRTRRWPVEGRDVELVEAMRPATLLNLLGVPGLVIPFDVTADGLPVGIQLVGRPWEEELLLELGIRMEEVRGPFPSPPGYSD
ncbi:MAG TPA: amidase [Bryobacteraceae bacterium]|nr:amidase [Bryobacteraceae bacterium]